jgi:hypothetical protein
MNALRKVLAKVFKDDFTPFTTENKMKLPNRAIFTGDKTVSKTGDPAKVENTAWHDENAEFKKFRNKEKKDDYTSLVATPEGRQETMSDKVANQHKWFRKFAAVVDAPEDQSLSTETPNNIMGEGIPDRAVEQMPLQQNTVAHRRIASHTVSPVPEWQPYFDKLDENWEAYRSGRGEPPVLQTHYPPDIEKKLYDTWVELQNKAYKNTVATFNKKAEVHSEAHDSMGNIVIPGDRVRDEAGRRGEIQRIHDNIADVVWDNETLDQPGVVHRSLSKPVELNTLTKWTSKKLNWRQKLAYSEPDINLKRKPDGTMELNVTHPAGNANEETSTETTPAAQVAPQDNNSAATSTGTQPTPVQNTATASLQKEACKEAGRDVNEWIIRKEGNLVLLGRECKDKAGIFILKFPEGALSKAAAIKDKLSFAIDKEIVEKNGHTWPELINSSVWQSKFDNLVKK